MIEPRIYRAAFVPALLAAAVAMFSLESRPRPLPQGLAADVLFDGRLAAQSAAGLARRHPDRRPGTLGDRATAREVAAALRSRGFAVDRSSFERDGKDLVNVIGRRAGRSPRQIAVVAARDDSRVPGADGSAADTAALLELARVLEGRPSRKSMVLASVDGSTLGEVGTERLVGELGDPGALDGVLVISSLAAAGDESPIVPWSNDSRRAGIGLERTVADSLRQEIEDAPDGPGTWAQLARIAFPIGVGGQGVLLERGFDAIRISGSGELPPDGRGGVDALDQDRLGGLGRATLRTVTALDQAGPPDHGPGSYVIAVSQVMPGWVLALVAAALLLPALVATVDGFARARRRRLAIAPWLGWMAVWILPFVVGLAVAELLSLVGATPEPPTAPVPPSEHPLDAAAIGVLVGVTAGAALAWWGARRLLVEGRPELGDRAAPGAGVALALVALGTIALLWVVNPYAGLVMALAAHLWMLAALSDPPPPRRGRLALVALGVLPPLLVALYYLVALSVDPLTGAWYLLLLVTGGAVGLPTALLGCALLGSVGAAFEVARSARAEEAHPDERPAVYGPGAHAGPGSLGGTESALRR